MHQPAARAPGAAVGIDRSEHQVQRDGVEHEQAGGHAHGRNQAVSAAGGEVQEHAAPADGHSKVTTERPIRVGPQAGPRRGKGVRDVSPEVPAGERVDREGANAAGTAGPTLKNGERTPDAAR